MHLKHIPKVHSKHNIPLLRSQSQERLVAQDTSISDQDMNTTKLLQSDLHDLVTILGRADGCSSFASSCNDLVDNSSGTLLADIVDDDVGAEFAVHESVGTSEAGSSTGDDDGLTVETDGWVGLGVGR